MSREKGGGSRQVDEGRVRSEVEVRGGGVRRGWRCEVEEGGGGGGGGVRWRREEGVEV